MFTDVFLLLFLSALKAAFLSPPSAGISFSPDSSPVGTSPLRWALLVLLFQEAQPAGKGLPACPLSGEITGGMAPCLLACCILLCLDEGRGFGQRLCEGIEVSLTPCCLFSVPGFCSRAGRFLASSSSEGGLHLVALPAQGVNGEAPGPAVKCPCPALWARGRCAGAAGCCREERLRGRREQSQNSSEMGREMRWLT